MLKTRERMLDPDIKTCIRLLGIKRKAICLHYNSTFSDDFIDCESIRNVIDQERAIEHNGDGEKTQMRRRRVCEILADMSQEIRHMNCY